ALGGVDDRLAVTFDAAAVVGELRRHPLQVRGPLVELRLQRGGRVLRLDVTGRGAPRVSGVGCGAVAGRRGAVVDDLGLDGLGGLLGLVVSAGPRGLLGGVGLLGAGHLDSSFDSSSSTTSASTTSSSAEPAPDASPASAPSAAEAS